MQAKPYRELPPVAGADEVFQEIVAQHPKDPDGAARALGQHEVIVQFFRDAYEADDPKNSGRPSIARGVRKAMGDFLKPSEENEAGNG